MNNVFSTSDENSNTSQTTEVSLLIYYEEIRLNKNIGIKIMLFFSMFILLIHVTEFYFSKI